MKKTKVVLLIFFSLPILWLGTYLTWNVGKTALTFEVNRELAVSKILDLEWTEDCFQASGEWKACWDVLNIDYSFRDLNGVERIDGETVRPWFISKDDLSQAEVSFDALNPTESTLFPLRKRLTYLMGFFFGLCFLLGGGLALYQAKEILRSPSKLHTH